MKGFRREPTPPPPPKKKKKRNKGTTWPPDLGRKKGYIWPIYIYIDWYMYMRDSTDLKTP